MVYISIHGPLALFLEKVSGIMTGTTISRHRVQLYDTTQENIETILYGYMACVQNNLSKSSCFFLKNETNNNRTEQISQAQAL